MASHITSSHLICRGLSEPEPVEAAVTSDDLRTQDRLLAAAEVAALLGVPRSFVYALARRRAIPTVRLGGRYVRFRRSAIEAWIADREQSPRSRP